MDQSMVTPIMNKQLNLLSLGLWLIGVTWILLTYRQCQIGFSDGMRGISPNWILVSVLLLPVISAYGGIRLYIIQRHETRLSPMQKITIFISFIPVVGVFLVPVVAYVIGGM